MINFTIVDLILLFFYLSTAPIGDYGVFYECKEGVT